LTSTNLSLIVGPDLKITFTPYIRRICRSHGVKVIFKSGPTMRDRLVKVKDRETVSSCIQNPGKFCIGETVRTGIKEHKDACIHGYTEKSAISEHACIIQIVD
jgi:hypothetical protein